MRAKTRDDLGLAITMLDSDRLRQWADKIDTHGDDISHWADRRFVSEQLRAVAGRIEATVREVGTLREMAGIHPAEPTPPADRPTAPCDGECESELTSHGHTPCRCDERARAAADRPNTLEARLRATLDTLDTEAADTLAALRAELEVVKAERAEGWAMNAARRIFDLAYDPDVSEIAGIIEDEAGRM